MRFPVIIAALAFASLPACGGSVPPPNDAWAASQADVGRAEAAGADNVPDAKLHLELARENQQKAKALIDQDNARAASLTAVAQVEAQYAQSLANQAKAEAEAQTAQQELQQARH